MRFVKHSALIELVFKPLGACIHLHVAIVIGEFLTNQIFYLFIGGKFAVYAAILRLGCTVTYFRLCL